ncbi:MAG: hypothetical protein ACM3YN_01555 [Parcubacteria group bacterium]
MTKSSQRRAVESHRQRMRQTGMDRFEVRGLAADKMLIREVARRLATGDVELRRDIERDLAPAEPTKGGILRAFRNSPLVGSGIDLERKPFPPRDIDL